MAGNWKDQKYVFWGSNATFTNGTPKDGICYGKTGYSGQARYLVVSASLL